MATLDDLIKVFRDNVRVGIAITLLLNGNHVYLTSESSNGYVGMTIVEQEAYIGTLTPIKSSS